MEETDNICFVCDKTIPQNEWKYKLEVTATKKRNVPAADLIKHIVGEEYAVLVGERDAVCSKCMDLLNLMDSLTARLEEVTTVLTELLHVKYNLTSESKSFQMDYNESVNEESEPLHKCSTCNFQTIYEKEFNIHVRKHLNSSEKNSVASKVSKKPNSIPTYPKSEKSSDQTKVSKITPKNTGKTITRSSTNSLKKKRRYPFEFEDFDQSPKKSASKKSSKPKKPKVFFQCSICEKMFSSESLIKVHAEKVHGKGKIEVTEEEEYADIQTLESDNETLLPNQEVEDMVEGKENNKTLTKNKSLDFLDDWQEDEKNDELTSPVKNQKTEKQNSSNEAVTKKRPRGRPRKSSNLAASSGASSYDDKNISSKPTKFVPSPVKKEKIEKQNPPSETVKRPRGRPRKMSNALSEESDYDIDTSSKPTCLFCHASFSSMEAVQDHIKMTHRTKSSHSNANKASTNETVGSFEIDSTTDLVESKKKNNCVLKNPFDHKSYKCNLCGIRKVTLQFIQKHVKVHKRKMSLQCKFCGALCKNVVGLKVHAFKCLKVVPVSKKCGHCKFRFFELKQLKSHIKKVHLCKKSKVNNQNATNDILNAEVPKVDLIEKPDSKITSLSKRTAATDSPKISSSEVSSTSLETVTKLPPTAIVENPKQKSSKKPRCLECSVTFEKPSSLKRHLVRHKASHCLELGFCIYCDKLFINKDQVMLHYGVAHGKLKTTPKCHVCEKSYSRLKDLKDHFVGTHLSEKAENLIKSASEQKLKVDESNQTDSSDVCNKDLIDLTEEPHDGKTNLGYSYSCVFCTFNSPKIDELRNHFSFHTKNFCHICNSVFSSDDCIKHIETHSVTFQGKKCTYCGEKLHDDVHLRYHTQSTHSGEKHHKCSMCTNTYSSRKTLLFHKHSQHAKKSVKRLSCSQCQMIFFSDKKYQTHIEFAHRISLNCKYCDKAFSSMSTLVFHERNHLKQVKSIYKCNICGKVLKSLLTLKTHKANNHSSDVVLKCETCEKSFKSFYALREHSAKHSSNQKMKYFCDICSKGFYFYDSHCRHRRIHLELLKFQ